MGRAILALFLVVAIGTVALADIPKTINFQGKLTSIKGVPVASPVNLTVKVYDGSGIMLFSETHVGVAVTNGIFNVLIGSKTVGGVPSTVFSAAGRSVGIAVGADGEMTPRQPLTAVPYAYVAETAQTFEVPQDIAVTSTSTLLNVTNEGTGMAIRGAGEDGTGVFGYSFYGNGVGAYSATNHAVYASSDGNAGVYGASMAAGGKGVIGHAYATTGNTVGVSGSAMTSASGIGVFGEGVQFGVSGSTSGTLGGAAGVHGSAEGVSGYVPGRPAGLWGDTDTGYAISGTARSGSAVHASSDSAYGVMAFSSASMYPAVYGGNENGNGIVGRHGTLFTAPDSNAGVYGSSNDGIGVFGRSSASGGPTGFGGFFQCDDHLGTGVKGTSADGNGVWGLHTSATQYGLAVYAQNTGDGHGVCGTAVSGYGVYGIGTSDYAAVCGASTGVGPGGQFTNTGGGLGLQVDGDTFLNGTVVVHGGLATSADIMAGGDLMSDGTVTAAALTYNSPRRHYLSIPGAAFVPAQDEAYNNSMGLTGAWIMHAGVGALSAGAYLPDGAIVTGLKAYYYDSAASWITCSLQYCYGNSNIAAVLGEVVSSGAAGYGSAEDTAIVLNPINNLDRSYYVRVYSGAWPGDSTLRIIRAVITYTVIEAE